MRSKLLARNAFKVVEGDIVYGSPRRCMLHSRLETGNHVLQKKHCNIVGVFKDSALTWAMQTKKRWGTHINLRHTRATIKPGMINIARTAELCMPHH